MPTQVTSDVIADFAVNTLEITDLAVTTAKLAANAVTTAKIAPDQPVVAGAQTL